jgi:hypothetical protein
MVTCSGGSATAGWSSAMPMGRSMYGGLASLAAARHQLQLAKLANRGAALGAAYNVIVGQRRRHEAVHGLTTGAYHEDV